MPARHRLSKMLLRHGRVYDLQAWTRAHDAWLRRQRLDEPAAQARRASVAARTAAINQLRALVVTAPSALRESLRGLTRVELVRTCARLHLMQRHDEERRAAVLALRATARRVEHLTEEATALEKELERLVRAMCPALLDLPGLGVITSSQILVSWSHPGRIRSEESTAGGMACRTSTDPLGRRALLGLGADGRFEGSKR